MLQLTTARRNSLTAFPRNYIVIPFRCCYCERDSGLV